MSDVIPETLEDFAHDIADEVYEERVRQINQEGFDAEHDLLLNRRNQLALAAAAYLVRGTGAERKKGVAVQSGSDFDIRTIPEIWPRDWDPAWFKVDNRRRSLIKAGALILAEIERMDRLLRLGGEIAAVTDQCLPVIDDEGSGQ